MKRSLGDGAGSRTLSRQWEVKLAVGGGARMEQAEGDGAGR